jgi:hypothetical protein
VPLVAERAVADALFFQVGQEAGPEERRLAYPHRTVQHDEPGTWLVDQLGETLDVGVAAREQRPVVAVVRREAAVGVLGQESGPVVDDARGDLADRRRRVRPAPSGARLRLRGRGAGNLDVRGAVSGVQQPEGKPRASQAVQRFADALAGVEERLEEVQAEGVGEGVDGQFLGGDQTGQPGGVDRVEERAGPPTSTGLAGVEEQQAPPAWCVGERVAAERVISSVGLISVSLSTRALGWRG